MLGVNLRWTSIPSRGVRNTPSRFMLQKPWSGGPLGSYAGLSYFYLSFNIRSKKENIHYRALTNDVSALYCQIA